jgi:tRNA threonylcarbamoyladenosine biosynthesis protein TsaE
MQTDLNIITHSADETHAVGKTVGEWIETKTVITLSGDLGAGKTVWVQGLARGLAVPEEYYVTSPTYTLINEYPGRIPLFHIDLYRLDDTVDLEEIGFMEILHGDGIVAIEWADRLQPHLPPERLDVRLTIEDESVRKIGLSAYGQGTVNLVRNLKKKTLQFQRTKT